MTLIEALQIVLGLVGAVALGGRYGWLGAPLGLVVGAVFVPALAIAVLKMIDMWQRLIRAKPCCVRGACDADGYHFVRHEGDDEVVACRCGDTYQMLAPKAGAPRRFVRLVDGHARPYRVRRGRRWVADDDPSGSPYR
jgi:hypothetical protein